MNKFAQIKAFVELVEAGSLTKAAHRLGVATSAISRRMSDLEQRLGVQLLQRTTRTMHLTESGRTFYQRCVSILSEIDDAEQQVSELNTTLTGELRVAAPVSYSYARLCRAINGFMHLHPQLTVDLDMSDRRVNLVEEGFDLAIRVGQLGDSSLRARQLGSSRLVAAASPEFIDQYGEPETIEQLAQLPALIYSIASRVPGRWTYVDAAGQAGAVSMVPRLRCSNGDALVRAAASGLGVCCEPDFIVEQALDNRQLVPIMQDYKWAEFGIYAVYPETRFLSVKARAFIDFLVE